MQQNRPRLGSKPWGAISMSVATKRVSGSVTLDGAADLGDVPVHPGDIVAEKFRIERIVGEGGMGVVVEATHLDLDERVALKFLRENARKNPEFLARFTREARALVKLKSEHVARVMDVGSHASGPFIVMEYLEGSDLANVLGERGPLSFVEAAEYVIQACEAVAEAHSRGIVHRDIKPENLFLVRRDDWQLVKVLDFGISKAALSGNAPEIDLASHKTTSMMGSPYYMSPEQLRSTKSVDHRADVWSLGAVLFELVTGHTAFDPELEFTELVAAILETPHRRATSIAPGIPVEFEAVIDRCLAKDREHRFASAAALAVALLPFAPRRARVPAERAVRTMRGAGLVVDHDVSLPGSDYPPPREDVRVVSGSAAAAEAHARSEAPTLTASPAVPSPVAMEVGVPATPAPAERRNKLVLALAALLFLGAVIIGVLVLKREAAPPDAGIVAAPTAHEATPPVKDAPEPAVTGVATGAGAPAVVPTTNAGRVETRRPGARHAPPPRDTKSAAPVDPPPRPPSTLEIRQSR